MNKFSIFKKPLILLTFFYVIPVFAVTTETFSERAKAIGGKVVACGKNNGWALSVAIVNAEGNLSYFQRSDDAYVGSIEAAIDKAKSANAFRRSTAKFVEGIKKGNLGLLSVKGVVANEGGLPILKKDIVIGAVGVSGATSLEDEKCALEALKD